MEYGICPLSIVPVRLSPADSSEMTSQLLFGEVFHILTIKKKWIKIRCALDGYEGWIGDKQLAFIKEADFIAAQEACSYSLELVQGAMSNNHYIPVTLGATLPGYDGMNFQLNGDKFTYSGQVITPSEAKIDRELLIKVARKYLYAPYLWGGRSPFGIDCSGLVQVVFKLMGVALPRDAYQQADCGELVDFVDEAQPGDLAFFENKKGRITHVGIIMQESQIMHASGQVRIDRIDHQGIYNIERRKYSHRLRLIKRIFREGSTASPKG